MRKPLSYLAILAALACLACENRPTEPSKVEVNVNVEQNQNGRNSGTNPSPSPSPGAGGQCPVIASTGISFRGDAARSTIRVGESADLDTTPKDSAGNKVDLPCAPSKVEWAAFPPSVCKLTGNVEFYNPTLQAISEGGCSLDVKVGTVRASRVIPVVP